MVGALSMVATFAMASDCVDLSGKYKGMCTLTEAGRTEVFKEKVIIHQEGCEQIRIRDFFSFDRIWAARKFTIGEERVFVDGPELIKHDLALVKVAGIVMFEKPDVLLHKMMREVNDGKTLMTLTIDSRLAQQPNGNLKIHREQVKTLSAVGKSTSVARTAVDCDLSQD